MSETDNLVSKLIRQRANVKTRLTKLEKAINEFEIDPYEEFELYDFEGRLARHTPLLQEAETITSELESLITDEAVLKNCDEELTSIEKRYYAINGRIKRLIKKHSAPQNLDQTGFQSILEDLNENNPVNSNPTIDPNVDVLIPTTRANQANHPNQAEQTNTRNLLTAESSQASNHVFLDPNLPKLSLSTFSGSFDTWLGFRDSFNSMVHDNPQVPSIFKFHYLKSCVKDEAAEVIASLEASNENYTVA